jgi:nitrite reductase/ring-hydroxylating ferredoxin subunit
MPTITGFERVARLSEVPPGEAIAVRVGDREIGLFNVNGAIYALDDMCPHQGAPLHDGWIEGCTVTCPWHAWCFDLATGRMLLGGYEGVEAFEVRLEDESIYVATEPRAENSARVRP